MHSSIVWSMPLMAWIRDTIHFMFLNRPYQDQLYKFQEAEGLLHHPTFEHLSLIYLMVYLLQTLHLARWEYDDTFFLAILGCCATFRLWMDDQIHLLQARFCCDIGTCTEQGLLVVELMNRVHTHAYMSLHLILTWKVIHKSWAILFLPMLFLSPINGSHLLDNKCISFCYFIMCIHL